MRNQSIFFDISADNISRAKIFYEKVLGWKIGQDPIKDDDGLDHLDVETGDAEAGIRGGLYQRPSRKENVTHLSDCTILVSNLDQTISALEDNGGKVIVGKSEIPKIGWQAYVKDTEENRFNLLESFK